MPDSWREPVNQSDTTYRNATDLKNFENFGVMSKIRPTLISGTLKVWEAKLSFLEGNEILQ